MADICHLILQKKVVDNHHLFKFAATFRGANKVGFPKHFLAIFWLRISAKYDFSPFFWVGSEYPKIVVVRFRLS